MGCLIVRVLSQGADADPSREGISPAGWGPAGGSAEPQEKSEHEQQIGCSDTSLHHVPFQFRELRWWMNGVQSASALVFTESTQGWFQIAGSRSVGFVPLRLATIRTASRTDMCTVHTFGVLVHLPAEHTCAASMSNRRWRNQLRTPAFVGYGAQRQDANAEDTRRRGPRR